MDNKLVFGYWNVRGRGQPIRFLLQYVEANYEERTYQFSNIADWYEGDRKTLKPFPNLPYIKDGDLFLTENDVVIKYIVRKHPKYNELLGIGKGNDEFIVEQLVGIINDLRQILRDVYFSPKYDEIKNDVINGANKKLNELIEFRGNNDFLLPYLTIADFKFIEVLLYYKGLDAELFAQNMSSFDSYIQRFHNLPRISEYLKTESYRSHNEFFPIVRAKKTGQDFVEEFNKQFQN